MSVQDRGHVVLGPGDVQRPACAEAAVSLVSVGADSGKTIPPNAQEKQWLRRVATVDQHNDCVWVSRIQRLDEWLLLPLQTDVGAIVAL